MWLWPNSLTPPCLIPSEIPNFWTCTLWSLACHLLFSFPGVLRYISFLLAIFQFRLQSLPDSGSLLPAGECSSLAPDIIGTLAHCLLCLRPEVIFRTICTPSSTWVQAACLSGEPCLQGPREFTFFSDVLEVKILCSSPVVFFDADYLRGDLYECSLPKYQVRHMTYRHTERLGVLCCFPYDKWEQGRGSWVNHYHLYSLKWKNSLC